MTSRGTTKAELNASMTRLLASAKARVDPTYFPTYRCSGGCEDTGWVTVDAGVSDAHKRTKAATVERCRKCNGSPPKPETQSRKSFS